MLYTRVEADAFQKLQMNAGIIAKHFNPATGVVGDIIAATTGGLRFATNPSFTDFGEDVDNVPANTMQLKRLTSYDPVISGTALTVTAAIAKLFVGGADIDGSNASHVIPRHELTEADFEDIWIVGDYSDKNSGEGTAGYVAIHIMNALNTAGFQLQTSKNNKGQFAFEFHGHYDIEDLTAGFDNAPFEIYVKAGSGSTTTPSVSLNAHAVTLAVNGKEQLRAVTIPSGETVTWASSSTTYAEVSNGEVTGKAAGSAIITASITVDGVTYTDTCTVVVES